MSGRRTFLRTSVAALASLAAAHSAGAADDDKPKLTRADIDAMMKDLSNWGRWGKDDQLGALNLITPAKRKQAAALVRDGVAVSLAHAAITERRDGSAPFVLKMTVLPKEGDEITGALDEYSVQYHGFTQTHIDALCHLIYKGRMYNGFAQKEVTARGAGRLAVARMHSGIFTRCVLMDFPRLFDVRFLKGGHPLYPKDLEAWEKKAGVRVESGDCVLVRTASWARRDTGPWEIMKDSAGLHASCLPWLKKRDISIVGSDLALDVMPSGVEGFPMPVHWVCGVALGTPILDNCDLEKVSEEANTRKRWAFLLTLAPLVVEGGTGSPVNPLAVF